MIHKRGAPQNWGKRTSVMHTFVMDIEDIHATVMDTSFLWNTVHSSFHPRTDQFKLGKI